MAMTGKGERKGLSMGQEISRGKDWNLSVGTKRTPNLLPGPEDAVLRKEKRQGNQLPLKRAIPRKVHLSPEGRGVFWEGIDDIRNLALSPAHIGRFKVKERVRDRHNSTRMSLGDNGVLR